MCSLFQHIEIITETDCNAYVKQNRDLSLALCGQSYQSEPALLFVIPEVKWRPKKKLHFVRLEINNISSSA